MTKENIDFIECIYVYIAFAVLISYIVYIIIDIIKLHKKRNKEPDGGWSVDFVGVRGPRQWCQVYKYVDNKIVTHKICDKPYPTSFYHGTYEDCKKWLMSEGFIDSVKCLGYQENIFIKKGTVVMNSDNLTIELYCQTVKDYYIILNREPVKLTNTKC